MAQNRDQSNKRPKPAQTRPGRPSQKARNSQTSPAARKPQSTPKSQGTRKPQSTQKTQSARKPQGTPKAQTTRKSQSAPKAQSPRKPQNPRQTQRPPQTKQTQPPRKPPAPRKSQPAPKPQPKQRNGIFSLRLVVALEVLAVLVLTVMLLVNREPNDQIQVQNPTKETVQTDPAPTIPPPTETEPVPTETEPVTDPVTESPEDPTQPTETEPVYVPEDDSSNGPTTVIHVAAAGDLNINDATVSAGKKGGNYDYTNVFMDVAPVFANADLALLNFEGNLVGAPYGTENVSAPQALAEALDAMGVDLVQAANSYSVTHGIKGLTTTLNNLQEAGLTPLGAFASSVEFQESKGYTIVNVKGIRIAFVAFTKGVGGLSLPAGSEDCVNLLYTDYATTYQEIDKDGINAILSNVAGEKPDLTIAMVHWGSEYKDSVTKNQEKIAKILKEGGVDVILGTHSHMLHQITYDELTGQMVAYSLGDFFGDAQRAGTEYSVILDLEITRDNVANTTRVTGYTYTPIYTITGEKSGDGQTRVVRLEQSIAAYNENFVGKVSQEVYESMEHALKRVDERINPPKKEEAKK